MHGYPLLRSDVRQVAIIIDRGPDGEESTGRFERPVLFLAVEFRSMSPYAPHAEMNLCVAMSSSLHFKCDVRRIGKTRKNLRS